MDNVCAAYTKENQLKLLGFKDAIIKKYIIIELELTGSLL